tara:strand:- start:2299 stop:2742 length:444 start_codon:yes stop_codon:yes gene_type:complete
MSLGKYAIPIGLGYLGSLALEGESQDDQVKKLLNDIKVKLRNGDPISDEMRGVLSGVEGAWKDLDISSDLLYEANLINDYLNGQFKQREDGKYEYKSLLLKDQEMPKDFILSNFPIDKFLEADKGYHDNPFTKDLPSGNTMSTEDFR